MSTEATRLELVERYVALKDAQKAADKDEAIKRYKEERKARTAECKEIMFALMQLVATDAEEDQVVVGDRLVVRSTKAKVTVNAETVKAHLGDGYSEFEDENKEYEDVLKIKRVPRPKKRARTAE